MEPMVSGANTPYEKYLFLLLKISLASNAVNIGPLNSFITEG